LEDGLLRRIELPRPGGAHDPTIALGEDAEIVRPTPAIEMSRDHRHAPRCVGVSFVRGDREEAPKNLDVVRRRLAVVERGKNGCLLSAPE
jgi:hypothetical protein